MTTMNYSKDLSADEVETMRQRFLAGVARGYRVNCAWCLEELGLPSEEASYGTCIRHAMALVEQARRDKRRKRLKLVLEISAGVLVGALILATAILAMFAL